jgi:hypothetical protein
MPDPPVATETTASPSIPEPLAGNSDAAGADSETTWGGGQLSRLGLGLFFLLLLVVGIAFLIAFFDVVRHWLALHTGTLHGGPDLYYNFWSGFGSDIGEATLITAVGIGVYTGVRKVNCHTKGCWRIGHHRLDGTPYILCRHHHPDVPTKGASHEHILEQHRKYKEAKEAREVPES